MKNRFFPSLSNPYELTAVCANFHSENQHDNGKHSKVRFNDINNVCNKALST